MWQVTRTGFANRFSDEWEDRSDERYVQLSEMSGGAKIMENGSSESTGGSKQVGVSSRYTGSVEEGQRSRCWSLSFTSRHSSASSGGSFISEITGQTRDSSSLSLRKCR